MLVMISFFMAACTSDNGNNGTPGENEVWMQNIAFVPQTLTVNPGTTVTWTNKDNVAHTVTRQGMFDSGQLQPGETFTYTFNTEGTYDYICTIHLGMNGTIIVAQ